MPPGVPDATHWLRSAPIFVIVLFALLIVRRNLRARTLKIERLWVYPVIVGVLTATDFVGRPPPFSVGSVAILVVSLALGCAFGWQRGRFTRITIDPETHVLTSKGSPIGVAVVLGLMVLKFVGQPYMGEAAQAVHLPVQAIASGLVLFSAGTLVIQRLEIWLRASKLLAEARAAKAATPTPSAPIVQ